jgi:hypothetical protein
MNPPLPLTRSKKQSHPDLVFQWPLHLHRQRQPSPSISPPQTPKLQQSLPPPPCFILQEQFEEVDNKGLQWEYFGCNWVDQEEEHMEEQQLSPITAKGSRHAPHIPPKMEAPEIPLLSVGLQVMSLTENNQHQQSKEIEEKYTLLMKVACSRGSQSEFHELRVKPLYSENGIGITYLNYVQPGKLEQAQEVPVQRYGAWIIELAQISSNATQAVCDGVEGGNMDLYLKAVAPAFKALRAP